MRETRAKSVVMLSETWTLNNPRDLRGLVRFAAEAEQAGIDAVMMGEHVVMGPNSAARGVPENPRDWLGPENQPPMYPHPNGLAVLSAVSSATSSIKLLAAALLTPLRHPLMVAKELATVDLLSEGRLIMMPGVSWQKEEFAALNVPFEARGAILDEQLEIWTRLWRDGSPVSFKGDHFDFQSAYVEPQPYRNDGVTLWTGGYRLFGANLQRLVRYSTGLFLIEPLTDDDLIRIDDALREVGRKRNEIDLAYLLASERFTGANDVLDLKAALAPVEGLRKRGYNTFVLKPSQFTDDPKDMKRIYKELQAALA